MITILFIATHYYAQETSSSRWPEKFGGKILFESLIISLSHLLIVCCLSSLLESRLLRNSKSNQGVFLQREIFLIRQI